MVTNKQDQTINETKQQPKLEWHKPRLVSLEDGKCIHGKANPNSAEFSFYGLQFGPS